MNAFDTNIEVRILVNDDPRQSAQARAAVAAFLTYDRSFVKRAALLGMRPEVRLP